MADELSERRLAENEVIFRQRNEKVPEALAAIKEEAKVAGDDSLAQNLDAPLYFYCECSDETCSLRILLKPSEYQALHQNSSQFVLLPGHNVAEVERIVQSNDKFMVVEKFITPPPTADKLNPTPKNKA